MKWKIKEIETVTLDLSFEKCKRKTRWELKVIERVKESVREE